MQNNLIFKIKASLIHLAASCCCLAFFFGWVFFVWYPSPWAQILGLSNIVFIIAAVDACLGPLLTFIVYQKNKINLKSDLLIIVFLQLLALAYGVHTTGLGRPVYLVYTDEAFYLVSANEVYTPTLNKKSIDLVSQSPWSQPFYGFVTLAARPTTNAALANELVFSQSLGGPGLANLPSQYITYSEVENTILSRSKPLGALAPKTAVAKERIAGIRTRFPNSSLTAPVYVKNQFRLLAILDSETGAIIGFEPTDVF